VKCAPWVSKPSWTSANKLYVIEITGDDGQQMQHLRTALGAAGIPVGAGPLPTATGDASQQSVTYIPFQWSDTRTQALVKRMKELNIMRTDSVLKDEITVTVAETGRMLAGQQQVELYERIKEYAVERVMRKSYFTDMTLTEHAKNTIDFANRGRETYTYEHLLNGFRGARFAWTPDTVVLEQGDVARLWATIKIAVKAAKQLRDRQ
jgi:hypothetical protein